MITLDRTVPTIPLSAASPTADFSREPAPLALARVFVWEAAEHAEALAHYFQEAGHPYIARGQDALPAPVRECVRGRRASGRVGQVFELFTLPFDLGAIVDSLNRDDVRRELDMLLDLSDLPLLVVLRKKRPADPLHPQRELRGILDFMPTWRPDGPAGSVIPMPTTAAQPRSRLNPPSSPRALGANVDDAALLESPTTFVG